MPRSFKTLFSILKLTSIEMMARLKNYRIVILLNVDYVSLFFVYFLLKLDSNSKMSLTTVLMMLISIGAPSWAAF